jgi:hypothetical protein
MRRVLVFLGLSLLACRARPSAVFEVGPLPSETTVPPVASATTTAPAPSATIAPSATVVITLAQRVGPNQNECHSGQVTACPMQFTLPAGPGQPIVRAQMTCKRHYDGSWRYDTADCATPLVVTFDESPVHFTQPAGEFPIGPFSRTEWVSGESPWLAVDLDGTGCIEDRRELFGPATDGSTTNGFDTLARLDRDGDGRIDARDAAFADLRLWFDRDQDRRCTAGEVVTLASAGIVSLDLRYARPVDTPFGSHEGETASMPWRDPDGTEHRGRLVDVYLAPLP